MHGRAAEHMAAELTTTDLIRVLPNDAMLTVTAESGRVPLEGSDGNGPEDRRAAVFVPSSLFIL